MGKRTENRKNEHIETCLKEDVQARRITTGFDEVYLVHNALPEINRKDIILSTEVLNHRFSAPVVVESMTGGTQEALRINAVIARAVEKLGLGMGVGSQRAAIEDPKLERTFGVARKEAPNAFIVANLGAPQLAGGYGARQAKKAVDMLKADALVVHMNPLQEAVQPEGETNYAGVLEAIARIVDELDVPVIVKETGCGIAFAQAKKLEAIGVSAINVAGAGGTSWAAVEYYRAKKIGDKFHKRLGEVFWDWGIPTAASLAEVSQSVHIPVIASGGIRTGIDAAKALALGASLVGMAYPLLGSVIHGAGQVENKLKETIEELKNTMFLIGADTVQKLGKTPLVITGKMYDWMTARGFDPQVYARRDM